MIRRKLVLQLVSPGCTLCCVVANMAAGGDSKAVTSRVEAFKTQLTMDTPEIPDKSKITAMSFVGMLCQVQLRRCIPFHSLLTTTHHIASLCFLYTADSTLFLGLATGDVVSYSVKAKDAKEGGSGGSGGAAGAAGGFGAESLSLLVKKKIGNKKPIQQMEVVRDQQTLYILCDGKLSAHDTAQLQKKADMIDCSSAHLFCVEEKPPYHICVSHKSKRQLFLYEYNRSMQRYQLLKELAVPDTVLALSWRGHQLVVGYKREYSMLNVVTGEVTDVPVPLDGSNVLPCIQITSDREMLLASSSDLAIFMNFKGEPVQKNTIHWSKSPIAKMAICSHYVCGLLPNSVEVASLLEQKIVQSFPFAKGISLVADDKKVIVASESKVMTLFLTSILDQVKQYLSAGFVDEALALLNKTAPSTKSLHDFHAEAGFVCLKNMQFDASTKHFVASNVDPRDVLSVFPDLQLKGMSVWILIANPFVRLFVRSCR